MTCPVRVTVEVDCLCCGDEIPFIVGPFQEQDLSQQKGNYMPTEFQMTDSQQTTVRIKGFQDKRGNPVTPSGAPTWLTDNTDLLGLTPADDGMSCVVKALGPLGAGVLSCKVDTPQGAIAGQVNVSIVAGAPTSIDLDVDDPTEQELPNQKKSKPKKKKK